MLLTVGVAAVWSAETFVYSLAAYAAITVFAATRRADRGASAACRRQAHRRRGRRRLRRGRRDERLSYSLVAGDWPRWTEYLSLVALYAMRGFGSLLIPTWSPGYLVGALYVLSLTALVALPRSVRDCDTTRRSPRRQGPRPSGRSRSRTSSAAQRRRTSITSPIPAVVVTCGWWTIARPYCEPRARRVHVDRGGRGLVRRRLRDRLELERHGRAGSEARRSSSRCGRPARPRPGSRSRFSRTRRARPRHRSKEPGSSGALHARDRPPVVLIRADRLTRSAPRCGPRQRAADRQRQSGRPDRRAGAQESGGCDRQTSTKEPSSSRRPCSCVDPPESFAQLDPIRDRTSVRRLLRRTIVTRPSPSGSTFAS